MDRIDMQINVPAVTAADLALPPAKEGSAALYGKLKTRASFYSRYKSPENNFGDVMKAVISSTGLWTPDKSISNEELVESFNAYVDKWNSENAADIEAGEKLPLEYSNAPFIEKASGIKSRFVISKDPILDPNIMAPRIPARPDDEPSICLLYTSPSPRDATLSRMPSSA